MLKIRQMHALFFHIKRILDLKGTMDTYKKCEHFQSFGEEKAGMERVTAKTGGLCHCAPFGCLRRSAVKRMRRQTTDISDKGLLPKKYSEKSESEGHSVLSYSATPWTIMQSMEF